MPSVTDDLLSKTSENAKKTASMSLKAMKEVKSGVREAGGAVKGICLVLIGGAEFTADAVMNAVREAVYKKTGDIRFSKNNINISRLRESGHVYQVEENVLQEAMKYFDQECKKYGVKYTAMKDTRGEDKPDYKPSYMVFFEGKDSNLILRVLQEAYKDYAEDQQRAKDAGKDDHGNDRSEEKQNGNRDRSQEKETKKQPEKRESVKAKLAFFRDRVAARDQERDAVEKHHQHTDIQR